MELLQLALQHGQHATQSYNVGLAGGAGIPVRRSFENPTTETDQRNLWGQGMPVGRPSVAVSGSRAGPPAPPAWAEGLTTTPGALGPVPVESRFEFQGTVAPADLDRATDAREKGRVGIFSSGYSYYGATSIP